MENVAYQGNVERAEKDSERILDESGGNDDEKFWSKFMFSIQVRNAPQGTMGLR